MNKEKKELSLIEKFTLFFLIAITTILISVFLIRILANYKIFTGHKSKSSNLYGKIINGPKMHRAHSYHASIDIDSNNFLFACGYTNSGLYSKYPELYNQKDNKFYSLAPTVQPHGFCSLIKRSDGRILLFDKKSRGKKKEIEIFDPIKFEFSSTNKKVFDNDKLSFNVLPYDMNKSLIYTDNALYFFDLYKYKLIKISQIPYTNHVLPIAEKQIMLFHPIYKTNETEIIFFDLNKKKTISKNKFSFQANKAIILNDKEIFIVDVNNMNLYIYNYQTSKIVKTIRYTTDNNSKYLIPEIIKLKNNKLLIYFYPTSKNNTIANKVYLYDINSHNLIVGPDLCYTKQRGANLTLLSNGNVLISGGQNKSSNIISSDQKYFNLTQIYIP